MRGREEGGRKGGREGRREGGRQVGGDTKPRLRVQMWCPTGLPDKAQTCSSCRDS